jgi:hypothetical protein
LVEGETAGQDRNRRADAMNAVGDLVDRGAGVAVGDRGLKPPVRQILGGFETRIAL